MKDIQVYRGARVWIDGDFVDTDVAVQEGKICSIGTNLDGDVYACTGMLIPGLIDVHIHGIAGHDTMHGAPSVRAMARALPKYGVTSFFPTTMNASIEATRAAIAGVWEAQQQEDGRSARIVGVHMEGPFLGEKYKGAQDARANLLPTVENFSALVGEYADLVKLITVAPDIADALAFITWASARGIAVSAGHTDASFETMVAARDAGLTQVTHLFNGMNPMHHRAPGVACAGLVLEGVYPQVIADGVHLHPAVVRLALRAAQSPLLITDAMSASGLGDGEYELGGQKVFVLDGQARLATGVLAGSTLTLNKAMIRAAQFAGIGLNRAVEMASAIPARAMKLADTGRIANGLRADLCLMQEDGNVSLTIVGGQTVYTAGN